MTLPPPAICRRIRRLHRLVGSLHQGEANNAREKLLKLLPDYSLSWNDVAACCAAADEDDERAKGAISSSSSRSTSSARAAPQKDKPAVNVLALVDRLIE